MKAFTSVSIALGVLVYSNVAPALQEPVNGRVLTVVPQGQASNVEVKTGAKTIDILQPQQKVVEYVEVPNGSIEPQNSKQSAVTESASEVSKLAMAANSYEAKFQAQPNAYISPTGRFRITKTGHAEFDLSKGLLRPQLSELLMEHSYIDSQDDIQWHAIDNLVWPNSHTISGKSIDHVINDLLKPYKLLADFKGNGNVIIKNMR